MLRNVFSEAIYQAVLKIESTDRKILPAHNIKWIIGKIFNSFKKYESKNYM